MSTNFLDLVNFGTILSPEALCPLVEPLPPDSAGAAGVVMVGLTTELTACLLEGEGGLRRRKGIKNKCKILEKYQFVLTYHCYQQRQPLASESLSTRQTARLSPCHERSTPFDWPTDLQARNNHDQLKIQQFKQEKEQKQR